MRNNNQSGAISRDTTLHNFRTGEILPPPRTNEQEMELIHRDPPPMHVVPWSHHAAG